ncbi:diguanylate cyclase domain-containing protein [Hydrocarboniphaga sp.]|uniref:GGDEF domain-containing protein n=1 Tax=Hydrocarboniphaga sp. TaxID=2033016 RepID=UPI003D0C5ABC
MNARDASLMLLDAPHQDRDSVAADPTGDGFADFYLHSTRQPAIYINLFFAVLLVLIVPVRSLVFGLPVFPNAWAALLEWGAMVPACLATAWLRSSGRPARTVARWTSLLIALNVSALVGDIVIWQRSGVPIPHEYSALCFVGFLSVGGLPGRTVLALCVLFLGLNVAVFEHFDSWTPAAGFKLYFDLVGICVAFLIAMMLRHEASVAWALKTRLNAMAFRDPLTGLANRHYLEDRVGDIFRQAQHEQKRVGLALVDLDRFKGLNDSHGHLAGDAALQRVGQELRQYASRPGDIAARIGGDEFLMIWSDITPRRGEELCRQLLRAIAAAGIVNNASETRGLTVSVGAVVGIPGTSQDFERFRRRADEALYQVKSRRNGESLVIADI